MFICALRNFTINTKNFYILLYKGILLYFYVFIYEIGLLHIIIKKGSCGMNKFISRIMLVSIIIISLIFLTLLLRELCWKIYILIYSNYFLGLLFPYPKLSSIALFLVITFLLLGFFIVRVATKLQEHFK